MKKIINSLFILFFMIAVTNTYGCNTCGCQDKKEATVSSEDQTADLEIKTCDKKAKECCSKSTNNKCSKSKEGSFNFDKTNNYGEEKSSCSKTTKKECCKKKSTDKNEEGNSSEK